MSETINNLKEFLAWRGFGEHEAWYWARCFYKYTDCGPWAVFLMRTPDLVPIEHPEAVARFRKVGRYAELENAGELSKDYLSLLGYDEQGLPRKEKLWTTYNGLVDTYISEQKAGDKPSRAVEVVKRTRNELHLRQPSWVEPPAAYTHEAYYEDLRTDKDGKTITYRTRSYGGNEPETLPFNPDLCAGIKFGSIVEGSEAYSGPFEHLFPFEKVRFERDIEYMEGETSFYWERDNSSWYVLQVRDNTYYLHETWGEIKWDDGTTPSPKLRKKVEEFLSNPPDDIPMERPVWKPQPEEWKPLRIPGTMADIYETYNDGVY